MKKLLVILALLVSFADARDNDGTVGIGLTAGGYGTGFIVAYDAYKFIYVPNTGNDAYVFDYEFWDYEIGSGFDFYVGVGVLYDGNTALRVPLGLDWEFMDSFHIYGEYGAQLATSNWTYQENLAAGLKIVF